MVQYPWNNFLQLKVQAIYEEIFENSENAAFRKAVLTNSNTVPTLMALQEKPDFQHDSERNIRYGYMASVIKLGNILAKTDKEEVKEFLTSQEVWKPFVEGELRRSNERNNKSLGGHQPRHSMGEEDDNDNQYEVNMEKIMARFTNFNQLINNSNSGNDDEEEDEENKKEELDRDGEEEEKKEGEGEHEDAKKSSFSPLKATPHEFKEQEPLEPEFVDSNYWRIEDSS